MALDLVSGDKVAQFEACARVLPFQQAEDVACVEDVASAGRVYGIDVARFLCYR